MADGQIKVKGGVDVDGEAYRLLACQIRESLSALPVAMIEIGTLDSANNSGPPDPTTMIGKSIVIKLEREDGSASREFAGIAVEATRLADKEGRPITRITAAPRLFRLGKRADCRTFQHESVPDIVKKVLTVAGLASDAQEARLSGSYTPREYVVQYRETDFDFIARLLSEEGIFFAVTFADGKDKVVFCDDPQGLDDLEGNASIAFAHTFGFGTSKDHVLWVKESTEVRSDKAFIREYDFERPKLALEAKVEGKDDGAHALEVYQYPGRFLDQDVGKRYAQVLLDSLQAERHIVTGEATVLTMSPGRRFTITDHPYEPLNQKLLITGVEIEYREGGTTRAAGAPGGGQGYSCRFTAVPTKTTAYRPPRLERAVAIAGVQTAMTTGPAGQEIHSDKHGRVKARYMWDRLGKADDTSSVWMRTSQVPTGGSMLLPRVGWEVALRHVEGDADEPIVMSRLYNTVTPPPYALPAGKARGSMQTATTPGGGSSNELRMDDTKGKEEMMFNASKDMTVDVVNNTTEQIGNNHTHTIGSNHKVNVTNSVTASVGASQTVSVGSNQTVHVETFLVEQIGGAHTLDIGGNRDLKIGGDHRREVAGGDKTEVGSLMTDLVVGKISTEGSSTLTIDVGTASALITAGDHNLEIVGDRTEATGAAKAVIAVGGRGVEVTGSMTQKVAGAILAKIGGDMADTAATMFTEVAAGAHILKADTVVFEGETIVSFVMGASTITLTPASISIAGVSIKIDGAVAETAALILDN
ncbi:MAG: type VI secretion system tip protein TssI/VgrG [Byssovorax sp.]